MFDLTPRPLRLLDSYADGEEARHFSLRIEQPEASDHAVIPGQFFMLSVPGQGEAPFTYVSLPDRSGRFSALIRRTGRLSAALFAQAKGSLLGYRGPFGQGWPLSFGSQRLLLLAGGCGLAPLAAVMEEAQGWQLPLQIRLLYGARASASQVLAEERRRWKRSFRLIETLEQAAPGQPAATPVGELQRLLAEEPTDAVFCCGPEPFMWAAAQRCRELGVPAARIWLSIERRMHCAVGLCGHCYVGASYACVDGPTYRYDQLLDLLAASGSRPRACTDAQRPATPG